jgi:hypothetical protein
MFIILNKCCKYFVLCLLYITDTTPWQGICISTTWKYNRSLEKHVLAHFQQTCSQIYFRFSSYLSRKPLLKRSTAFICNIDRDWIFWHWCLERQTFGTPRMYTLSPSKSIKESNYREFLKDKNLRAVENRRTYRTVGQKLTRSDLNFFASDPMSGAIFQ